MNKITMRQLAAKLGLERSHVYRLIRQKKLPAAVEKRHNTAYWSEPAVDAAIKIHKIRVRPSAEVA